MAKKTLTKSRSTRGRTSEIRQFILENVRDHSRDIATLAMGKFGISRQAANAHLKAMVDGGILSAEGRTRARTYRLPFRTLAQFTVPVAPGLNEDSLWHQWVAPWVKDLPPNVQVICYHGFTEMVNNVIDHAGSADITVVVQASAAEVRIDIADHGVGIFNKIRDHLHLDDERQAMLELAKGKLTTDPDHHSGEGIFFTSRMFDGFTILSGHFAYVTGADKMGVLIEEREDHPPGTFVDLRISRFASRTVQDVYDVFIGETQNDEHAFTRTIVPLRLARYEGEELVSRSQAKRVMTRVEEFQTVILDFEGVDHIGQAFADEVFRVWQVNHPNTVLLCENASAPVMRMVNRARRAADLPPLHSRRINP